MVKKIYAITIVLILLISLLYYFVSVLEINENKNEETQLNKYFTAREGKVIADKNAKKWREDAILLSISAFEKDTNNDGRSTAWEYLYYSPSSENNEQDQQTYYDVYDILINKELDGFNKEAQLMVENSPLIDWKVDSNEAFEIAFDNETVKNFFIKYPDASLISFKLEDIDYNSENFAIWYITWDGEQNNLLTRLEVEINATNGDFIKVYMPYQIP